jgi:exosortase D (VPLPA-CTERM-specific)
MALRVKFPVAASLISFATLLFILLWFYWSLFYILWNQIYGNEDFSYGLLLPLVSLYIVYLKWPTIRQCSWQASWKGLVVMAVGFGLYTFGDLVAFLYLPTISFIVVLAGLIYLFFGWGMLRLLIFPLFLLLLVVPLPSILVQQITFNMQLISSRLAAGFLHVIGIPLVRRGNVIDLGIRQLQVVEACSGLRYILSLFALASIFCYFFQRRFWKAAILIFSIFPSAIVANALRVAAMGLIPAIQQEGFWHDFTGWLIFLVAFGVLALVNRLLNYLSPEPGPVGGSDTLITPQNPAPASGKPASLPLLIAGFALVLAFTLWGSKFHTSPVPMLQSFDHFPMNLGGWQGERSFLNPEMAKRVGADDYLEADYKSAQGEPVSMWIAYFESQSKKIQGRIHSPLICLSGSGWKFITDKIVEVAPGFPVNYLLMEQSGQRYLVYYWYLQGGRWVANDFSARFLMGYNVILRLRNDAALVRLITPAGDKIESAQGRLNAFTRLLIPLLPQFFPK